MKRANTGKRARRATDDEKIIINDILANRRSYYVKSGLFGPGQRPPRKSRSSSSKYDVLERSKPRSENSQISDRVLKISERVLKSQIACSDLSTRAQISVRVLTSQNACSHLSTRADSQNACSNSERVLKLRTRSQISVRVLKSQNACSDLMTNALTALHPHARPLGYPGSCRVAVTFFIMCLFLLRNDIQ